MSNETLIDSINRYAVAGAASDDAFKGLRERATYYYGSSSYPAEEFRAECAMAECDFMDLNYGNDPDAKHTSGKRAGQYKFRSYLPVAYSSAKTELAKGLAEGIDPTGKGKSELAKIRKTVATAATTPLEKARKHLANLNKSFQEIPFGSADYDAIVDDIRDAFGHAI